MYQDKKYRSKVASLSSTTETKDDRATTERLFALSYEKDLDEEDEPPYPEAMSWVHKLKMFGDIRIWGQTLWEEPYVLYMEMQAVKEAENIFANQLLEELEPDDEN